MMGVGRENSGADQLIRIPPRKVRRRFCRYKHKSLTALDQSVGVVVGKWNRDGCLQRATNFIRNRYDVSMDIEKSKELWDHLDNEPERAYRAFESFLILPSG